MASPAYLAASNPECPKKGTRS
ncbi:hypothetical protein PG990_002338 [Apiospora arundinis]